ncbi:Flagellar motor switch protein FliN [Bartonella ancashensis]|uniref:Flagellar motor switch protein FliN n=2 Tax=Bartonella ancashensis TaxID=1318743 RepID=A0A0M4LIP5_9HYPH|nr:Flagellar motor switch protein FliN [Bartonella ancashensis]
MTNKINPPGGINPVNPSRPIASRTEEGGAQNPGAFGAGIKKPRTEASGISPSGTPSFGAAGRAPLGGMHAKTNATDTSGNTERIMSIPVEVQIVLGSTTMPVSQLMNLGRGSVITLDKQIGDLVDIVVNGRVIARGEVIVLEDDSSRFGVSLIEIIDK